MRENTSNPKRKTDWRTLMTRRIIRDALLDLLQTTPYTRITVTMLCRQAEITRAIFYLHYENIDEVLDEILNEALRISELDDLYNRNMERMTSITNTSEQVTDEQNHDTLLPACQRAAADPRYRPLFMDEALSQLILNKIYQREHDEQTKLIMSQYHVNQKDADMIFIYQLHGSFAVNKALGWQKNAAWYHTQDMIRKLFHA